MPPWYLELLRATCPGCPGGTFPSLTLIICFEVNLGEDCPSADHNTGHKTQAWPTKISQLPKTVMSLGTGSLSKPWQLVQLKHKLALMLNSQKELMRSLLCHKHTETEDANQEWSEASPRKGIESEVNPELRQNQFLKTSLELQD